MRMFVMIVLICRDHSPPSGQHWVVIGVLVSKSISTTSSGSPYSRWRISDLTGSDTWVSLFGDAHKDYYAEVRQIVTRVCLYPVYKS